MATTNGHPSPIPQHKTLAKTAPMPKTLDSGATPKELAIQVRTQCPARPGPRPLPGGRRPPPPHPSQPPPEWLGADKEFLASSRFTRDAGLEPRTVYRNLSPAQLYEKVRGG
jgi:hypothetical protein